MATIKEGGVYKVGDQFQNAKGEKVSAPRSTAGAPEGTALPDDFPGRAKLVKGKITTLEAVRAAPDADIIALDGIAETLLQQIRAAQGA